MIISAACRAKVNGELNIFPVHRHCDFYEWMKLLNCSYNKNEVEEGFINWDGNEERFVSRAEAGEIAFDCGQIPRIMKPLFSEDLY